MSNTNTHADRSSTGSQLASALAGGVAGLAVGLVLAQMFGGVGGILEALRGRDDDAHSAEAGPMAGFDADAFDPDDDAEYDAEDADDATGDVELGDRVLDAFRKDPTLLERPIDIDVGANGIIELWGRVDSDAEIAHATAVAAQVPGVRQVVARLGVKDRAWSPAPA